jgi:hypothetical protein
VILGTRRVFSQRTEEDSLLNIGRSDIAQAAMFQARRTSVRDPAGCRTATSASSDRSACGCLHGKRWRLEAPAAMRCGDLEPARSGCLISLHDLIARS